MSNLPPPPPPKKTKTTKTKNKNFSPIEVNCYLHISDTNDPLLCKISQEIQTIHNFYIVNFYIVLTLPSFSPLLLPNLKGNSTFYYPPLPMCSILEFDYVKFDYVQFGVFNLQLSDIIEEKPWGGSTSAW